MSAERATPTVRGAVGDAETALSYIWQTPFGRPKKQPADLEALGTRRGRLARADRSRLERIVSGAPEVMVKITGRTKDVPHLVAHLAYITRDGQLSVETEEGIVLTGREGLRDLQSRWVDDVVLDTRRRSDATLSVNLILSMPPGTEPTKVRDAVRAFALGAFDRQYDFAFVQHEDEAHPHIHLTVRALSHDGHRLNPRKADLHRWREQFAEELRLRGVAAEATPRRARGRLRKADQGVVRAIRERGAVPRVDRLAREAVVREALGEGASERLWEAHTAERQLAIRARYRAIAEELARSPKPEDRAVANQIAAFLSDMPTPNLQRHALRQDLAGWVDAVRSRLGMSKQLKTPEQQRPAGKTR